MNHLEHEKSPYLLQHADNPVDWYPWCEEALARAKQENKPVFLSIGYSTCHWCHVMEHESFADQDIAEKLNSNYISIKVDREERPDLDGIYMQACHLMNGQGGWPLNLFLCPDGKPFYAMTYAPPRGAGQHPGFADILDKIAEIWKQQPEKLAEAGNQLAKAVIENELATDQEELKPLILETAARQYRDLYDEHHGGFGRAPKFPQPHNLSLLLRLGQRFSDPGLTEMALRTLSNIARGGITDQLGGGMHRYSVDDRWIVPHFEKMLYDQALIADAYLDAWLATHDSLYSDAARHILDYCLGELYHDQGGFYCGEDADSEGAEGTFYLWSQAEIEQLLSASEYQAFSAYFQISEIGNFEGRNILFASRSLAEAANECGYSEQETQNLLDAAQKKLLTCRASRPRPHFDDKILAGWNGLIIATLARAGRLLGEDTYLKAALQSTDFIARNLFVDGYLKRRYRAGESDINAFHEDYAFLIYGLTEIFLSTGKTEYIDLAKSLMDQCTALFSDGEGGFFDAAEPFATALGRGRTKQDGAIPAGASVTAFNLIRLARLTGQPVLEQQGRQLLEKHLPKAGHYPTAFAFLLQTLDLALLEPWLLIIVTPPGQRRLTSRWHAVTTAFRPAMMTVVTDDSGSLGEVIPSAAGKYRIEGKTTAWLCSGNACQAPINEPDILERFLEAHLPLKTFNK